jgi:hypothetical protein
MAPATSKSSETEITSFRADYWLRLILGADALLRLIPVRPLAAQTASGLAQTQPSSSTKTWFFSVRVWPLPMPSPTIGDPRAGLDSILLPRSGG